MSDDLGTTRSGLKPTHAACFTYVFGWITGLVFFLLEKENQFVRFHAMQSICFSVGVLVLSLAVGMVPILGTVLAGLLALATFVVWIALMVKACQGKWFRLPVVGDVAAKQAGIETR